MFIHKQFSRSIFFILDAWWRLPAAETCSITTIVIIRHQLDLNRPVSALSNSLFKGLRSRLRPNGLQFNVIFATLLLFILATCRIQFDLYLRSFSSTGSTFSSSKILNSFLGPKKSYPAVLLKKISSHLMSVVFLILFSKGPNFAHGQKNEGARSSAVGWGTAGRSRVWFPMVSLEFFIDIILPAALWPWGWFSL
jgi:hypothetical protein